MQLAFGSRSRVSLSVVGRALLLAALAPVVAHAKPAPAPLPATVPSLEHHAICKTAKSVTVAVTANLLRNEDAELVTQQLLTAPCVRAYLVAKRDLDDGAAKGELPESSGAADFLLVLLQSEETGLVGRLVETSNREILASLVGPTLTEMAPKVLDTLNTEVRRPFTDPQGIVVNVITAGVGYGDLRTVASALPTVVPVFDVGGLRMAEERGFLSLRVKNHTEVLANALDGKVVDGIGVDVSGVSLRRLELTLRPGAAKRAAKGAAAEPSAKK
jgi:hypothetical protein